MQVPGFAFAALAAGRRALDALLPRDPASGDGSQAVVATAVGPAKDGRLVVAVNGRTFAVRHDADAAAGETPEMPSRLLTPATATGSARYETSALAMSLTSEGRLLATLPPVRDAVIRSATALAPGPAPTGQLAQGLKAALDASGLFYESHLAEWTRGERALGSLRREPQMEWTRPPLAAVGTDVPGRAEAPQTASDAAALSLVAAATSSSTEAAVASATVTDLPAHARELVAQQLAVHDLRSVAWEGDVWPGLPSRIAIEEDPGGAADDPAMRTWRVTIVTELPALGRVESEIRLAGEHASVSLQATDQAAAARLAADRESFRIAIASAGVPLAALTIKHND